MAVLDMGGIGKTLLVTHLAVQLQDQFACLIWRSLRNAPPFDEILAGWILFLSHQQVYDLPANPDQRISLLLDHLRQKPCLLVLDNAADLTGAAITDTFGVVLAVAYSPNGRLLATSSEDETIKLWEVPNGVWVKTLRPERPYERMNITGVTGLTEAQKVSLKALGAMEEGEI